MSLKDNLMQDFKEAMKAHDEVRKNTVNLARAAIKQYEVDHRTELDDQGIVEILAKQVKMRKDALSDFEKAGRTDLAETYKKEIEILTAYLPAQLSEAEITKIIQETAAQLGVEAGSGKAGFGKLMGAVMPKVKGVADGNAVKKLLEAFLA